MRHPSRDSRRCLAVVKSSSDEIAQRLRHWKRLQVDEKPTGRVRHGGGQCLFHGSVHAVYLFAPLP
ncbi:hypothetical protein D3C86_2217410 [compost metagenome]